MAKTTESVTDPAVEPAADVTAPAVEPAPIVPEEWVVAKVDLFLGHVRAVSAGDRVHIDTVKNNGWDELVEPA